MKKKSIANAIARKELMITKTIEWKNGSIDIDFNYYPYYEARRDKWGQKQEPDCEEEFEIDAIFFKGIDIIELFDEDDLMLIQEKLSDAMSKVDYD